MAEGKAAGCRDPLAMLWDTDALLQVFMVGAECVVRNLKESFGVQGIVRPEVELEVVGHAKFGTRFQRQFEKTLDKGLLSVLFVEKNLAELLPDRGWKPGMVEAVDQRIERAGRQNALVVDDGEAYSHAAAHTLDLPLVTHDRKALETLKAANLYIADPVLRLFDLIVFLRRENLVTETQCKRWSRELNRAKEHLPQEFHRQSFEDGLRHFDCRVSARKNTMVAGRLYLSGNQ